jgi:hypothetical protein
MLCLFEFGVELILVEALSGQVHGSKGIEGTYVESSLRPH